ncbi:unnamed protein product [Strongylus vulgaris]|uniref:Uncharacterized protein n=1 Tax=Strongylus vulgaris TaxID=40348 RepID=A0A3P7J914_STRVU|nr:unnamed protein product [Strongylus vulgaris]
MMRWILLPAILCLGTCQDIVHLGHNHPAAAPDLTSHLARNLNGDPLLSQEETYYEGLIDPEGRRFIEPLKKKTIV